MEAEIIELEAWMAKELPEHQVDRVLLTMFILGCKHRQEVARFKLKNYYNLRKSTPELFDDRDPTKLELSHIIDCGVYTLLPHKLKKGNGVILIRSAKYDTSIAHLRDLFKLSTMVADVAMYEEPLMCEHGFVIITDLEGFSWSYIKQLNPYLMKTILHSLQNCYPVRVHSIHFINCPMYVSVILDIIKRFMSEKLKKRINTYSNDYEGLFETVPPEILPNELKGTGGPMQKIIDLWKKKLNDKKEWLLQQIS